TILAEIQIRTLA
ncbi:hypothetical protein MK372_01385, partial [Streptococcus oralis]|nr:hypothetical protein [Streptococcus oralis]